ncbi:SEL1-like repeat protein [Sediminicoccus rosea]|uniref:Sel1 repeat-containing protein n=1 Tax=Sediminicoccus rosea TaxID=1225128 RepID=A0ABZ0PI62_9PROT|nr:hypothetical protein [Sediminicoccus rosea]WPB85409.1 hypothetical protein R9Z33_00720 [Sediminicoccus rosea]
MGPAAAKSGYRIHREGYQSSNLGQRGWQVSEEVLHPIAVEPEGEEIVFILGPRITRHMEPGPVHLVLPGLGETGLFWPETIEVFDGELPPDPVIPAERPVPPPAPTPDAPPVPRPVPPPAASSPPPPAAPPAPARGAPVALWGGLGLLLLLAAGGGAWWLWGRDAPPAAPLAPPQAAPTVPPPARPAQPQAAVWPDGTDDLALRDVVGRAADAAAIFAVALRRQAAGRHDDALVLLEEAAARGHAPAMTALGRLYDPIGFQPGRPFRTPDPRAAARQYAEAERAGDPAALPLRAALRAWLQQQADAGQASAATTLREFW